MKNLAAIIVLCSLLLSCNKGDNSKQENEEISTDTALVHLNGTHILDEKNNPLYLKGIAFTNFIWNDSPTPTTIHHSEMDYERVKAMNMNVVRFYMNYHFFEDDSNPYTYKQSGWDWLDTNIAWAKKNDIYLILNMHVPQGGYQSQGTGDALWENIENQNRLAALWKAIAERYKNESQIAGFGPVNEPVPTSSINQWSTLAQKLINEIRTVDQNHLLFIERAIYVKGTDIIGADLNFPNVTGDNLVYEFHGYDPYFYTHQLLDFANLGDGGKYPDENVIEVSSTEWKTATFNNPKLNSGTTEWAFFEGEKYKITNADLDFGVPALVAATAGGTVFFDDIKIDEFDANGVFVRTVAQVNLEDIRNWYFWSENNVGSFGISTTQGNLDTSSFYISETTGDANLSSKKYMFEVQQNHSYQISGWMKGENVSANSNSLIRLDFMKANGPIFKRNKAFLEAEIGKVVAWAKTKNAALYMGEFGAGNPCFESNKGGLQFVTDMLDINKQNNIHFTYHAYHETPFGLYLGETGLPDPTNANQELIDLFTAHLN